MPGSSGPGPRRERRCCIHAGGDQQHARDRQCGIGDHAQREGGRRRRCRCKLRPGAAIPGPCVGPKGIRIRGPASEEKDFSGGRIVCHRSKGPARWRSGGTQLVPLAPVPSPCVRKHDLTAAGQLGPAEHQQVPILLIPCHCSSDPRWRYRGSGWRRRRGERRTRGSCRIGRRATGFDRQKNESQRNRLPPAANPWIAVRSRNRLGIHGRHIPHMFNDLNWTHVSVVQGRFTPTPSFSHR